MESPMATDCNAIKSRVHQAWLRLGTGDADARADALSLFAEDYHFHGAHPVNDLHGVQALNAEFLQPLHTAFRHMKRTHQLVVAGEFNGDIMVAILGHWRGVFAHDWLGIPANHKIAWLRFGEIHRVKAGLIFESWCLFDTLDLMRQAGFWPIAPSLGTEGPWPAPAHNQGDALGPVDAERGQESLAQVLAMHAGLGTFDGKTLDSMDFARHWTEDFAWYGPSGIGSSFGLDGFRAHHQIPFLTAFPDRRGGQHVCRIGDGPFVVTGGWPSVTATHTGDGFLGLPATGRPVGMRVMDFYSSHNGLIAENWVPLDIAHLLLQMGYDVFDRLRHLRGHPRTDLS